MTISSSIKKFFTLGSHKKSKSHRKSPSSSSQPIDPASLSFNSKSTSGSSSTTQDVKLPDLDLGGVFDQTLFSFEDMQVPLQSYGKANHEEPEHIIQRTLPLETERNSTKGRRVTTEQTQSDHNIQRPLRSGKYHCRSSQTVSRFWLMWENKVLKEENAILKQKCGQLGAEKLSLAANVQHFRHRICRVSDLCLRLKLDIRYLDGQLRMTDENLSEINSSFRELLDQGINIFTKISQGSTDEVLHERLSWLEQTAEEIRDRLTENNAVQHRELEELVWESAEIQSDSEWKDRSVWEIAKRIDRVLEYYNRIFQANKIPFDVAPALTTDDDPESTLSIVNLREYIEDVRRKFWYEHHAEIQVDSFTQTLQHRPMWLLTSKENGSPVESGN